MPFCIMMVITKATKSKSKKQFQHGVRIGFFSGLCRRAQFPGPPFPCKLPWITFVTMTQAHVSMTLHITSSVFLHQQICRCLAQALSQKDAGSTCGSHLFLRPQVSDNLSKAPFPRRESGSHNNADLTGFFQNSEIYIYKSVSTGLMNNSKHALLQGIFPTEARNLRLLCLLHSQGGPLPRVPPGSPNVVTSS